MESEPDPLAQLGLDAIDLRWTLKDIAAKRTWMINKQHLPQLIDCPGTHVTDNGWQRKFEDPIPLPDGWNLITVTRRRQLHHWLTEKGIDLPE
jgi:hypothetical protein